MFTAPDSDKSAGRPAKQFLSRRELAERWSCCVETLKNRERAGLLKPVRFGSRSWRYRLSEILALEAAEGGVGQ